jgi:hypothetical protein
MSNRTYPSRTPGSGWVSLRASRPRSAGPACGGPDRASSRGSPGGGTASRPRPARRSRMGSAAGHPGRSSDGESGRRIGARRGRGRWVGCTTSCEVLERCLRGPLRQGRGDHRKKCTKAAGGRRGRGREGPAGRRKAEWCWPGRAQKGRMVLRTGSGSGERNADRISHTRSPRFYLPPRQRPCSSEFGTSGIASSPPRGGALPPGSRDQRYSTG